MPRSKSAQKAARSSNSKRLRYRSIKSATKTNLTKAEKLIASKELEQAEAAVTTTISSLDKAAKKNVIHPNTASRRKSRLMKKLNKSRPAQTGETKKAAAKIEADAQVETETDTESTEE